MSRVKFAKYDPHPSMYEDLEKIMELYETGLSRSFIPAEGRTRALFRVEPEGISEFHDQQNRWLNGQLYFAC